MAAECDVKAYVRPDKTAVIKCPACNRQKEIKVEKFTGAKSRLKIKCSCQKLFTVQLEYRKRFRKKTSLRGTYVNHSRHKSQGRLVVKNISVSGLEFTTVDIKNFKVDDEVTITFSLDDQERTQITKDVIVMEIREQGIGCEFERGGEFAFDGPLGFYIMS